MRWLLLAVLLCGCGGKQEQATPSNTATKTRYTPSQLHGMKEPPTGEIDIRGKVINHDTGINNDGTYWMELADQEISVTSPKKTIVVRFSQDNGSYSESMVKWFKDNYKDRPVMIKATVKRLDSEKVLAECIKIY